MMIEADPVHDSFWWKSGSLGRNELESFKLNLKEGYIQAGFKMKMPFVKCCNYNKSDKKENVRK